MRANMTGSAKSRLPELENGKITTENFAALFDSCDNEMISPDNFMKPFSVRFCDFVEDYFLPEILKNREETVNKFIFEAKHESVFDVIDTITSNLSAEMISGIKKRIASKYRDEAFFESYTEMAAKQKEDILARNKDKLSINMNADETDVIIEKIISELIDSGVIVEVPFSHNTINRWLAGSDPSNSAYDVSTRNNIYKVAAILGCDYGQTSELFEKVFFSIPFYIKNKDEACFYYFAKREYDNNLPCQWYVDTDKLIKQIPENEESLKTPTIPTKDLRDDISLMAPEQLRAYLYNNQSVFDEENKFYTATDSIKKLVSIAKGNDQGNDGLINEIMGFSNRSSENNVTKNELIPENIRKNLPTGQILSQILSGDTKSGDKIGKMLKLILFYQYFRYMKRCVDTKSQFSKFCEFMELTLDDAGFPPLYPGNPYDALLLSCATREDPIESFQEYFSEKNNDSIFNLYENAFSSNIDDTDTDTIYNLLEHINFDPFLARLISQLNCKAGLSIQEIIKFMDEKRLKVSENDTWKQSVPSTYKFILQYLISKTEFTSDEKKVLQLAYLFPKRKLSKDVFLLLLNINWQKAADKLRDHGWLLTDDKDWEIDYRIHEALSDQSYEPTWGSVAEEFLPIFDENIEFPGVREMKTKLYSLDGAPKGTK